MIWVFGAPKRREISTMDNKKCTNDLCIKHINNIISVYDLSGCDKWFLRQLRSCEIYCRLNPLSKYYKLLIPKDVEFHINYKIAPFKTISCPLNKLDSKESRSLGIVCTLEEGDINNG